MNQKWKKEIIKISTFFILSRMILIIAIVINKNISFLNSFDAQNYLYIAEYGYQQEVYYAFFPLFPMLIKLFHIVIPSYQVSALLLSNICSYLSAIMLYKLIIKHKYRMLIMTCFIFSPILIYNSIAYTESLFLLLTITAYYLYKEDKYLLCGVVIGLSMITRNSGIVLLFAIGLDILIKIYKKEKSFKDLLILSSLAIVIGFTYSIYLYINTGDFFKYVNIQFTNWGREKANIITALISDIKYIITNQRYENFYIFVQNWGFYIFLMICGIKNVKNNFVQSIYVIISLILFTTTIRTSHWLTLPSISLFRYVFGLFPIYILPFINEKKKNVLFMYYTCFPLSIINSVFVFFNIFLA